MAQTRIGVIGCGGRMGRMLVADITATDGCMLAGGIARPGGAALGRDVGELAGLAHVGIAVGDSILLTPPRDGVAGLVWVLPVLALVTAAGALTVAFRRWRRDW